MTGSQGQRWGRSEAARRADGEGEEASSEGLGGYQFQTDGPAGQVVGHHLHRSQAPLAAKRPEGRWLSPAVLEVSDGVLDLGVAPMVGLLQCPRLGR